MFVYKPTWASNQDPIHAQWSWLNLGSILGRDLSFLLDVESQIFQEDHRARSRVGAGCLNFWTNTVTEELHVSDNEFVSTVFVVLIAIK